MPAPKSLLKGFEKAVVTVRPDPKKRITIFDKATTGLCLVVSPRGRKTFTLVGRAPAQNGKPGKQIWKEVGNPPEMTVDDARAKAREGLLRIKAGEEPFPEAVEEAKPESFNDVAHNFLKRHVKKEGQGEPALRSTKEIERQIDVFFRPKWGEFPFADIKRSHIAKVMRDIADERGPVMADRALANLSKLFKLQAEFMDDDWQVPTVGIVRKIKASARARTRVLADDEGDGDLRLLWGATGGAGTFGAFVRTLLLTARRRAKVAAMKWVELSEDGTWAIPAEPGEKGNADRLKLPVLALEIIKAQPRIEGNPYVFAARAKGHLAGFGPLKAKLDAAIRIANDGIDIKPWTLHDLRRTAKSLMVRAGVRPDISERVLGHAMPGVEGIYDRHDYFDEKGRALVALARIILPILGKDAIAKHAN